MKKYFKDKLIWRVFINAGWSSLSLPVTIGLGLIQTGLMARMLGPEGIGAITLFGAVCAIFGGVLKFTSAETAMVYVSKSISQGNKINASHLIHFFYIIDILSSILAFIAVFFSSLIFYKILNIDYNQGWLQAIYGLTLIFQSPYWTSHALLRVVDRFSWTFFQSIAHSFIKTIGVYFLFINGAGLSEAVYLLVIISFIDGLSIFLITYIGLKKNGLYINSKNIHWWNVPKEIWNFQWLGYGRQVIKTISRNLDSIMIGYIGNPTQVGYYRVGVQINNYSRTPTEGFIASLFPEYSKLYFSKEILKLKQLVLKFMFLFICMGSFVGLGLWFGSDTIIKVIFGNKFLPAKDIVMIMALSAVIMIVMSPIYSLPAAVGKAGPAFYSVIFAVIVQIILMFYLVPKYGAIGAAWSNVAYVITWAVILIPSIIKILRNNRCNGAVVPMQIYKEEENIEL